jgi:hypothetical protein
VATWEREADHLDCLLEDRDWVNAGRVDLGVPFLDDCLGGVHPRDLLLVGAGTGIGKTELAIEIALSGASAGLQVYGFFLEAEVGEVAARLFYKELAKRANNRKLDFGGWWRGQWQHLDKRHGEEIKEILKPKLANLHTLYKKRGDFNLDTLNSHLEGITEQAGMIILDHIHMVGDDEAGRTIQLLRDIALDASIPVIAVSHVRKKQSGRIGSLLPETDDLHGDSALSKVGTQVVVVGRDWHAPRPQPHLSPTLMKVLKDRKGRANPLVARVHYDLSKGRYERAYELGRLVWAKRTEEWQMVEASEVPYWAHREARRLEGAGSLL